ncbi:hypothetical protein J6590_001996 [Homalodisca vitripennis]|nr:hypothetical protein J6590_001996 [Homalodisca vitripennis]
MRSLHPGSKYDDALYHSAIDSPINQIIMVTSREAGRRKPQIPVVEILQPGDSYTVLQLSFIHTPETPQPTIKLNPEASNPDLKWVEEEHLSINSPRPTMKTGELSSLPPAQRAQTMGSTLRSTWAQV